MARKKPENQNELAQDIENHPERGQINGEDIVRFDTVDVQVAISKEAYRQLLEIGGALGMNKTTLFNHAIATFISMPGSIALVEKWQATKAENYGVTKLDIRSKVFGSYKKVGRSRSLRTKPD